MRLDLHAAVVSAAASEVLAFGAGAIDRQLGFRFESGLELLLRPPIARRLVKVIDGGEPEILPVYHRHGGQRELVRLAPMNATSRYQGFRLEGDSVELLIGVPNRSLSLARDRLELALRLPARTLGSLLKR